METDDHLLRRCKQVIEQLQHDLAKSAASGLHKQQLLHKADAERNHLADKNQQLHRMVYEMKEANVSLRQQVRKSQGTEALQREVANLQSELRELTNHLQNKQHEIESLQRRLREQTANQKSIDQEISLALSDIGAKMTSLEGELSLKNQENHRLEQMLKSKKCECCEAVVEIKNLASLRKKIDDTLRFNIRETNENTFKTVSGKKTLSIAKQSKESTSDRKSGVGAISSLKSGRDSKGVASRRNLTVSPFVMGQKSNMMSEINEETMNNRRISYSNNKEAVNETLRQIEDKLNRMTRKLAETEDSDMSILSLS